MIMVFTKDNGYLNFCSVLFQYHPMRKNHSHACMLMILKEEI